MYCSVLQNKNGQYRHRLSPAIVENTTSFAVCTVTLHRTWLEMMYENEDDEVPTCPLCIEELDATDRPVKMCQWGCQVFKWCLHTIREHLYRQCTACRTLYEENNLKIDDVNLDQANNKVGNGIFVGDPE